METILNYLKEHEINLEDIKKVDIYERDKFDCPEAIGHILCDIYIKSGKIYCIRFPLDTDMNDLKTYIEPLIKFINKDKL